MTNKEALVELLGKDRLDKWLKSFSPDRMVRIVFGETGEAIEDFAKNILTRRPDIAGYLCGITKEEPIVELTIYTIEDEWIDQISMAKIEVGYGK